MEVSKKVKEIIAAKAELGSDFTIETSHDLRDDLNLNSLDLVELSMDLEKEFDVMVPDEIYEKGTDVQSVINIVESEIVKKES
ncbi:MAG: phosphopantetheine-binding protein [Rikenellaceae bacterium]